MNYAFCHFAKLKVGNYAAGGRVRVTALVNDVCNGIRLHLITRQVKVSRGGHVSLELLTIQTQETHEQANVLTGSV